MLKGSSSSGSSSSRPKAKMAYRFEPHLTSSGSSLTPCYCPEDLICLSKTKGLQQRESEEGCDRLRCRFIPGNLDVLQLTSAKLVTCYLLSPMSAPPKQARVRGMPTSRHGICPSVIKGTLVEGVFPYSIPCDYGICTQSIFMYAVSRTV